MTHPDITTITLTADEVRTLDVDALRARCADLAFPCSTNLEPMLEWLQARPNIGPVRLHLRHATLEAH